MTAAFTQTGGVRISLFNATWPLATIEATEAVLCLRCFWKCWSFPKHQIIRLSQHRRFSIGLRIQHSIPNYSRFGVFWTFDFAKLRRALEERGYTVYDAAA